MLIKANPGIAKFKKARLAPVWTLNEKRAPLRPASYPVSTRIKGRCGRPSSFVSGAGAYYFFDNLTASPEIVATPAG